MKITYREALRLALHEALEADPRVFLMGEDVGRYGGSYAISKDFLTEFRQERIRDTPLSELGFVGAGIGAAMNGMRPIVEVMTVNFSLLALDQIVNTAATLRHMSGGQFGVPLVIRMKTGAGRQLGAQHSHSFEGVVCACARYQSTGACDRGLMRAACWRRLWLTLIRSSFLNIPSSLVWKTNWVTIRLHGIVTFGLQRFGVKGET